ncbi:ThiF family adenylyltransferase [Xanthomarina spongicola]|uniref:E2/UBC family protein B n=1 Tax=Xanthomarina spongicola TaxID=570520 RepID=A0A316DPX1_9FLAO|nr:ThiF family adenylyltransferase [Xanthomarina spongicola]PWK20015.1 E2/UBC family protein B [Xanthomarina spongicola]
MFDFKNLLDEISKTENCNQLNEEELKSLDYDFFENGTVWQVSTEITIEGKCTDITLYINFPTNFPFSFPKIFINKSSYEPIKYIPHINSDLSICIFDEGNNPVMPKSNLIELLCLMLSKAKKIITCADDDEYKKEEFLNEFKAYWELVYSEKDTVSNSGFHSINNESTLSVKGIGFTNKMFCGYEYFISNNDADLDRIKNISTLNGYKYQELSVIIIDNPFDIPPYDTTFMESLILLQNDNDRFQEFKKLCKSKEFNSVIIVFKNTKNSVSEYYGWTYKNVAMLLRKHGGYRNTTSKFIHLNAPYNSHKLVSRLSFDNISLDRLQIRTTGYVEEQKSIVISGLGSIGSNLIYFLRNLPINKFHLIDNDSLSPENIKRHYLGLSYSKYKKVDAIKNELCNINPLNIIEIRDDSVNNVILKEPTFINDCDFHIVAIGKTNVENFILENIQNGVLSKPTILFWVEPFLASGQMLFVLPKDAPKVIDLISQNNFPFHVLDNVNSQLDKTYIIEGSCQSGYFPYSSAYLTYFLSMIFPYLKLHLLSNNETSKIYSWIGDKALLKEKLLITSQFGNSNESFQLIINEV